MNMATKLASRHRVGKRAKRKVKTRKKDFELLSLRNIPDPKVRRGPMVTDRAKEMGLFRQQLRKKITEKRKFSEKKLESFMTELQKIEIIFENMGILIRISKEMLNVVTDISLLYKDPLKEVKKFANTYEALHELDKRGANGETMATLPEVRRKLMENISRFIDIDSLNSLYAEVFRSSKRKSSTKYSIFEIPHVDIEEIQKLNGKL